MRDLLHYLAAEIVGFYHHCQRIAGQLTVGKNIEQKIFQLHFFCASVHEPATRLFRVATRVNSGKQTAKAPGNNFREHSTLPVSPGGKAKPVDYQFFSLSTSAPSAINSDASARKNKNPWIARQFFSLSTNAPSAIHGIMARSFSPTSSIW